MKNYHVEKPKQFINIPAVTGHRKEWEEKAWEVLLHYLQNQTSAELKNILNIITSSRERHDIIMRATALDRLQKDASYREIGRELWLSPQTISAIKRALTEKIFTSYKARSKTERKKRVYDSFPSTDRGRNPMLRKRNTKFGTMHSRF